MSVSVLRQFTFNFNKTCNPQSIHIYQSLQLNTPLICYLPGREITRLAKKRHRRDLVSC